MLLLTAALFSAAATPPLERRGALATSTNCPRTTGYYAWQQGKQVQPKKLTELPQANAYSAVYRTIGGCEVPVIVRFRVGR